MNKDTQEYKWLIEDINNLKATDRVKDILTRRVEWLCERELAVYSLEEILEELEMEYEEIVQAKDIYLGNGK